MSNETKRKMSEKHKGRKQSPEHIKKRLHDYWSDPEWASKQVHSIMSSQAISPNIPETVLLDILNELYPGDYKFIGDGSATFGGVNPDFINVNNKKIIIECFGDFWHSNGKVRKEHQTEIGRKKLLAKYGFHTLVIWQSELFDLVKVKEKICAFVGQVPISH